ncbi:pyridoxamine 5'-phosphate oxidase family protein [Halomontanus rarus]|uniref:pyridoxamine 5'-phosphate oxidase family protein n=1 Tax=Halomontanus rarus TaxID=3034020 RepID=UPI002FF8341C
MDDERIEERLERRETGVLALAADGSAYAIPVAHHYEDESLYVRLADDGSSTKMTYLEKTDEACFTLYDVDSAGNSSCLTYSASNRTPFRSHGCSLASCSGRPSFPRGSVVRPYLVRARTRGHHRLLPSRTGRSLVSPAIMSRATSRTSSRDSMTVSRRNENSAVRQRSDRCGLARSLKKWIEGPAD